MIMRFWYDCEFLDTGHSIDLISIGIVANDGREYYAINMDAPWQRISEHRWLVDNVLPHLPHTSTDTLDLADGRYRQRSRIAAEVRTFLLGEHPEDTSRPELWAWYGAFDHVALAWLWGPMCDMPAGIPFWTNDLKQLHYALGEPPLPPHGRGEHDALADARWNRRAHQVLERRADDWRSPAAFWLDRKSRQSVTQGHVSDAHVCKELADQLRDWVEIGTEG
jgi:hypothetical protein